MPDLEIRNIAVIWVSIKPTSMYTFLNQLSILYLSLLDIAQDPQRDTIQIAVIVLQFIIAISILNVWVLQYAVIKEQFREFQLPDWVRNAVGAAKGVFCIMLIAGIWVWQLAVAGSIAIGVMMLFAILSHIRAKDPFPKIFPAVVLFVLCFLVAIISAVYKFKG